ncbi:MAG: TPM domain-containing protein [Turicibacter sp.]
MQHAIKRKIIPIGFLFLCLFAFMGNFYAQASQISIRPTTEFYVNDYANVLDNSVEQHIININKQFERTEQKPQIVVLTVPTLDGIDVQSYALEVFEKFKIGNKNYDNGILVLLATEERAIRIEVGYGLEGAIPDAVAGRIMDASMNELSSGDYSKALYDMFNQLVTRVQTEYGYDNLLNGIVVQPIQEPTEINPITAIIGAIVLLIIISAVCKVFGISPFELLYLLMVFSNSNGGGGRGGSGGSSGGGGRSGGGGASRNF